MKKAFATSIVLNIMLALLWWQAESKFVNRAESKNRITTAIGVWEAKNQQCLGSPIDSMIWLGGCIYPVKLQP